MSEFKKSKFKLNDTFINVNLLKQLGSDPNNCLLYKIPLKYEFRPDLIAYDLYKDVSMQDYLCILNDIYDSPEGFYKNRVIRVLKPFYKDSVC